MFDHIRIGDVSPRVQYAADGVQTTFIFPFPVFSASNVEVYLDDEPQSNGYDVAGVGESGGGTVIFDAAPAGGVIVTLRRFMTIERTTDFQEGGTFLAKTINDELDRQAAFSQQLEAELGRCLRLAPTDPAGDPIIPKKADRASRLLGFDGDGDPTVSNMTLTDIESGAATAAASAGDARASANNAASSASAARTSEINVAKSEINAAASAAAAAAAAAGDLYGRLANVSGVVAPTCADNGTLYVCDTASSPVVIDLPAIGTLEGIRFGAVNAGGGHTVTIKANGSDTINGASSMSLADDTQFVTLIADDNAPDNWIGLSGSTIVAGAGLRKTGETLSLDRTASGSWTGPQRAKPVAADDGCFDMSAGQDFACAPNGDITIRFKNITLGQRGLIFLSHAGHAIGFGTECRKGTRAVFDLSKPGSRDISYWSCDGATVNVNYGEILS